MKYVVLGLLLVGLAFAGWQFLARPDADGPAADVVTPDLSDVAMAGRTAYRDACGECHGPQLTGTDKGPPLIHAYYEPGHHPDASFYSAIIRGARQHHWRFGDMEPVPDVSEEEARLIVRYVREMQRANGIGAQ